MRSSGCLFLVGLLFASLSVSVAAKRQHYDDAWSMIQRQEKARSLTTSSSSSSSSSNLDHSCHFNNDTESMVCRACAIEETTNTTNSDSKCVEKVCRKENDKIYCSATYLKSGVFSFDFECTLPYHQKDKKEVPHVVDTCKCMGATFHGSTCDVCRLCHETNFNYAKVAENLLLSQRGGEGGLLELTCPTSNNDTHVGVSVSTTTCSDDELPIMNSLGMVLPSLLQQHPRAVGAMMTAVVMALLLLLLFASMVYFCIFFFNEPSDTRVNTSSFPSHNHNNVLDNEQDDRPFLT